MFKKLCNETKCLKEYNHFKNVEHFQQHPLAPIHPCRILVTGPTGSGKTLTAINLIFEYLPWTRLYINCKNTEETRYEFLREILDQVSQREKFKQEFYSFNTTAEDIVTVDQLDKNEINLIIFDDFVVDKDATSKICDLFIRGRKKNASILYLTQSFYACPKIIRLQCNYYIFFRVCDDREVVNIFQNLSMGLHKQKFVAAFKEATSESPKSFFMIDLCTDKKELRLRKNFDCGLA